MDSKAPGRFCHQERSSVTSNSHSHSQHEPAVYLIGQLFSRGDLKSCHGRTDSLTDVLSARQCCFCRLYCQMDLQYRVQGPSMVI